MRKKLTFAVVLGVTVLFVAAAGGTKETSPTSQAASSPQSLTLSPMPVVGAVAEPGKYQPMAPSS